MHASNPAPGASRDRLKPKLLHPYSEPIDTIFEHLDTTPSEGLSEGEVTQRRAIEGSNELEMWDRKPVWHILFHQIASPVVGLLAAAMALSIGLRDWPEASAVAVILIINTTLGFAAELNATRSMEALRKLDRQSTRVRRGGRVATVPSGDLVCGDIVIAEAGDRIPADLRLISGSRIMVDESMLTGESLTVEKTTGPVAVMTPIHDRTSMVYKGTNLTSGALEGVVTATGYRTELGQIARLVQHSEASRSPLEDRLATLARQLIWLTLLLCLTLGVIGLWQNQPVVQMIQATIALAVAAIPEGLPIVATLCLARGMLRMADKNALVRSLGAVETLGATSVIMTDKTGTLTENRLQLVELLALNSGGQPERLSAYDVSSSMAARRGLSLGALCSNAEISLTGSSGDPLEVALMEAAQNAGFNLRSLVAENPRVSELAFDPDLRLMATMHTSESGPLTAVKGAPEAVLSRTSTLLSDNGKRPMDDAMRDAFIQLLENQAADGLRLIAIAQSDDPAHTLDNLTLVAIAAFQDPPRSDVKQALKDCHEAGLSVVMMTGDHPATANAIAKQIGFDPSGYGDTVHARIAPADKMERVKEMQMRGSIVAMTGDGVNDAPALKKADIGIAMGIRGTDVAKEAADIVLTDDRFSTIIEAIREGRVIFQNIRLFCVYLLSCNLGEILLISLALIAGLPLPLLPLQILFLNLVTDVFPAFALTTGEGDPHIAKRPPRPSNEPILAKRQWILISIYGLMISVASFVAYWLTLTDDNAHQNEPVTVAFLTIGFAQLVFVFALRDVGSGVINNSITRNGWIWLAGLVCAVAMVGATYLLQVAEVLSLTPPSANSWMLILLCAVAPTAIVQIGLIAVTAYTHQSTSA